MSVHIQLALCVYVGCVCVCVCVEGGFDMVLPELHCGVIM